MIVKNRYEAVVIGSSAGGLNALKTIFKSLDRSFRIPFIIVQHISPDSENYLIQILNDLNRLNVKEADEKEVPRRGMAYLAPPNYHLLVEPDRSFTLTVDERVNYARPSIDVLFETAAEAYRDALIGIVLTGANNDGSKGLKKIKEFGGVTIVQDPENAEVDSMPKAAIRTAKVDHILTLEGIAAFLNDLENPMNQP
ncbi:MAG TPA: chemotaxis protein CheB [Bacteroidales bacterium]|nr:chemotaxis protein CheB [Bacteroidales bacterium]HPS51484.1 chemotaxis protein CheB [Bacteroidales bacterium]